MRSGKGYAPVAEKGMLTIWLAWIQWRASALSVGWHGSSVLSGRARAGVLHLAGMDTALSGCA